MEDRLGDFALEVIGSWQRTDSVQDFLEETGLPFVRNQVEDAGAGGLVRSKELLQQKSFFLNINTYI